MATKPSLPAPNQPKVFKVTEAQKRQWFFFWVRKQSAGSLAFMLLIPVFLIYMRAMSASVPAHVANGLTAMALVAWLGMLFFFRSLYEEHLRRLLEVEVQNAGLKLRSGLGNPVEVNWFEVNDACKASSNELVIDTKHGSYYLPADVIWANELIAEVRSKGSRLVPPSDFCVSIREGVVHNIRVAVFAVIIATAFSTGQTILIGQTPSIAQVAGCVIAFIGAAFIIKILRKLPLILKVGADSVFVRTLEGDRRFAWTQIKGMTSDSFSSTVTTTDGKLWLPWGMYTEESKKLQAPPEKQLLAEKAQKVLKLT